MIKVATILADGFEEIEALTVVDVLRRAAIHCDMVGLEGTEVTGSHAIRVHADKVFKGSLDEYDLVYLPGGMPGAAHLRDHEVLIRALQDFNNKGGKLAAICAAPIVLNRAGLLEGKDYTSYDGIQDSIEAGNYIKQTLVVDGNIITSRGPSTALALAYQLVEQLGGDAQALRKAMLYDQVFPGKE